MARYDWRLAAFAEVACLAVVVVALGLPVAVHAAGVGPTGPAAPAQHPPAADPRTLPPADAGVESSRAGVGQAQSDPAGKHAKRRGAAMLLAGLGLLGFIAYRRSRALGGPD